MSKAEELAKKYRFALNHGFAAAIDEALEWAAQQCEIGKQEANNQKRYHVAIGYRKACETAAALIRDGKEGV